MSFTSLDEHARRFGHYRWVEQRLFEVVGGWVPTESEREAKVLLRSHSFRHAWRSTVWEERLPRTAHLDPEGVTRPARPAVAGILDALAAAGTTRERLAGAYEIFLPELLVAYETERAGTVDATQRWLGVVADAMRVEIAEGQALIETSGPAPAEGVAAALRLTLEQGGGFKA